MNPGLQRFHRRQLPRQPWKNGAGKTREIVCQPAGASIDDFDWRVSIADLRADGPFSCFASVERTMVLLDGSGVHLGSHCGAVDHTLDQALQPFVFDGGLRIQARLLGGPSEDLNIMTRHGRCRARVDTVQGRTSQGAASGVLLVLSGRWHAPALGLSLDRDEGLWWAGLTRLQVFEPHDPAAKALLIRITAPA
jgi:environmental stress-induced protein Ves